MITKPTTEAVLKLERENQALRILIFRLQAKITHMHEYPFLPVP